MSEEKIYVVKNDEGKYWDTGMPPWWSDKMGSVFKRIDFALRLAKKYGGHVVTLIEEPEKVVLTKEQAEVVDDAHGLYQPATCISNNTGSDEEELMINAYVNGYTVAKEKKYKVRVPETQTSYYYKSSDGHVHASDTSGGLDNEFSDYELQQYGLDGERFTKEEMTDDGE